LVVVCGNLKGAREGALWGGGGGAVTKGGGGPGEGGKRVLGFNLS